MNSTRNVERQIVRQGRRRIVLFVPPPLPPIPRSVETTVVVPAPSVVRVMPGPSVVTGAVAVRASAQRLPVAGVVAATAATGVVARRVLSAGIRRDANWDHNRSMMRLVVDQEKIRFTYEVPRAGLASLGINRGTLLLDGRNTGGLQFAGTAYTFSRQCTPAGYEVRGEASREGDRLEVRGARPIRNERCDTIGHEDERLEFVLLALRQVLPRDVPAPLLPVEAPGMGVASTADEPMGRPSSNAMSMPSADPAWSFNGAPMRVEVEDKTVRFFYESAQAGSTESGASSIRQKPMFEGVNVTDKVYAGSAYAYSPQCGDIPYRVQGTVAADGGRLELSGLKPELDSNCGVAGQRQETLVFELK